MRLLKIVIITLSIIVVLNSCVISYWVYIRNLTSAPVTLDVFVNDLRTYDIQPTYLQTADSIISFKKGHKKYLVDTTKIKRIDSTHFQFQIRPNNTVDLERITRFFGFRPTGDIKIIVTSGTKIDTLMTSPADFKREKFWYKGSGFGRAKPILYYDVRK